MYKFGISSECMDICYDGIKEFKTIYKMKKYIVSLVNHELHPGIAMSDIYFLRDYHEIPSVKWKNAASVMIRKIPSSGITSETPWLIGYYASRFYDEAS